MKALKVINGSYITCSHDFFLGFTFAPLNWFAPLEMI